MLITPDSAVFFNDDIVYADIGFDIVTLLATILTPMLYTLIKLT